MLSHSGSRIIALAGNTIIQLFLGLCQPDLIMLNSLLVFRAVFWSFSSFLRTELAALSVAPSTQFPSTKKRATVRFRCPPSLAGSH